MSHLYVEGIVDNGHGKYTKMANKVVKGKVLFNWNGSNVPVGSAVSYSVQYFRERIEVILTLPDKTLVSVITPDGKASTKELDNGG